MVDTDSIPRTTLRDLFFALIKIANGSATSLELLRQHFCVDRKCRVRGDLLYTTAAYNAQELTRLGLLSGTPVPKTRRAYEQAKDHPIAATDAGLLLAAELQEKPAAAYDRLFTFMFQAHPYLRSFVKVIRHKNLFVPAVTSLKDHISPKYVSAGVLLDDVSKKNIDLDPFFDKLSKRLSHTERILTEQERVQIAIRVNSLLDQIALAAASEDPTEFAKKFITKLNDYMLPVLFEREELTFDYRTHQLLWSFGQGWKLWQSTNDHPEYDGRLIFRTSTIRLSLSGEQIEDVSFDTGLEKTGVDFLGKLYNAYLTVRRRKKETYVVAGQLRAVFCLENRCQESVFERLMEKHYAGSDGFEVTLEIQRQKALHDRPLRIGNRSIGLVRVGRKRAPSE